MKEPTIEPAPEVLAIVEMITSTLSMHPQQTWRALVAMQIADRLFGFAKANDVDGPKAEQKQIPSSRVFAHQFEFQEGCLHCHLLQAIAEFAREYGTPVEGHEGGALDAVRVVDGLLGALLATIDPLPPAKRAEFVAGLKAGLNAASEEAPTRMH